GKERGAENLAVVMFLQGTHDVWVRVGIDGRIIDLTVFWPHRVGQQLLIAGKIGLYAWLVPPCIQAYPPMFRGYIHSVQAVSAVALVGCLAEQQALIAQPSRNPLGA